MFHKALLQTLQADGALAGYLNTYLGNPSIFSDQAPEKAKEMYLVFTIERFGDENIAAFSFNVYLDFYDYDVSRANVRAATERVEFLLDHEKIVTDPSGRFDNIRFYLFDAGFVPEPDTKKIHYNMQFTARAGRKAWAAQLT